MKRLLLAGIAFCALVPAAALAADLPAAVPMKGPAYVAAYNWSGLYVGVNAGYGWASGSLKGALGGAQLGYNVQMGSVVLGLETDIQATGMKATMTIVDPPDTITDTQKLTWFGTTRARVGFAVDRLLPYFTGGVAYGQRKSDGTVTGGVTGNYTMSATKVGWTAGAGIEGALAGNWTWKVEYLYLTLPGYTATAPLTGGTIENEYNKLTTNIVRAGVNLRF